VNCHLTCLVDFGDIFALYEGFGYLGILLISFIGSIIIFIPVPYFPVLVTATLNRNFDPHVIALASAVGAVAAKMIIFYGSYYGRNMLSRKTKKRILPLQRLLSKYGWAGAFVASVTPVPDDVVYIPLGLAKYNPWKFATAVFVGKLILNEMIVVGTIFIGRPFVDILSSEKIDPIYLIIGAVVSAAVLGLLIYFSLRIDWSKIIGKWFPWTLSESGTDRGKKDSEHI
jgi:membrane protein DedA with SNARE-associated domain